MRRLLMAALLAAGFAAPLKGQTATSPPGQTGQGSILETRPAEVRLLYESLEISSDETMGLAGVGFLMDFGPYLYGGGTVFGAMAGERGGFFTGGASAGLRANLFSQLELDAGGFFGGGGGGSAPQGGGMMVRLHTGVSFTLGAYEAGGGFSWVKFPNGEIDSKQAYLTLSTRFLESYGPADLAGQTLDASDPALAGPDPSAAGLRVVETEWFATGGAYLPLSGVETTRGEPMTSTMSMVGVEFRRHVTGRPLYFLFQAAGAAGGRSDGYAEAFGGVGLSLPLIPSRLFAELNATAGAGGGGNVDTSGGAAGKVHAGLGLLITPSLSVGGSVGRIASAGSFSAESYQARLGYRFGDIRRGGRGRPLADGESLTLARWRLGAIHQTVFDAQRKASDPEDMSLIGLRFDRFLRPWFYITGQAYAAHTGHAGGYAIGLLGVGFAHPLGSPEPLSFPAEAPGGGSGGGGVDVAGGATFQAQGGLHWRTRAGPVIYVGAGRTLSSTDRLNSPFVSVGVGFEVGRVEGRY
ncbi:MAG: hypothetical protein ABIF09_09720 [Gemmatimonadota bacterium]